MSGRDGEDTIGRYRDADLTDWEITRHNVVSIPRPRPVDPRAAVTRDTRAAMRARAHEARQSLALGIIVGFFASDLLFVVLLVLALRHWGMW